MSSMKCLLVHGPQDVWIYNTLEEGLSQAKQDFLSHLWDLRKGQWTDEDLLTCQNFEFYVLFDPLELPLKKWADGMLQEISESKEQEMLDKFNSYVDSRAFFEGEDSVAVKVLRGYSDEKKLEVVKERSSKEDGEG